MIASRWVAGSVSHFLSAKWLVGGWSSMVLMKPSYQREASFFGIMMFLINENMALLKYFDFVDASKLISQEICVLVIII